MTASNFGANGPTHRAVEAGVTILIGIFGGIVILGSIKAGINWGAEGPRAGFFPFYIGLFIVGSSVFNLRDCLKSDPDVLFAEWSQLRQVCNVLVPASIYVASMPYIGLYVASFLFIGWFTRWLGKYNWPLVTMMAVGMPVVTYLIFERWFLVPLPKGPLEDLLGL